MHKILAIDDKMDNLITLSALLKNLMPDCVVITAQSGMEGIAKAKEEQPDAILLDVKMPEMDGFETCRRLMADEITKRIPVIMITAIKTDPQSRIRGLEIGANTFLAKPIDQYELVSQVKVALRIKEAEDALRLERNSLEKMVETRTASLRQSEEKYQMLVENISDVIFEVNSEGLVTYVSPIVKDIFGYDQGDIIGKNFITFVYPEDQPIMIKRFLELGTSVEYPLIYRLRHESGEIKWVRTKTRPIMEEGRFVSARGTLIDITEQKRIEETLRDSEKLYRSLFDSMLNGLAYCKMHFDDNGKPWDFTYLSVNSAFETLTGLRNVIGKKVTEAIPGIRETDPELLEIYGRVSKTGKPERFEIFVKILQMWFSISVYSPAPEHFVAVFDVITDRKHAEEEKAKLEAHLHQAQKMESIGYLAGGVAHDFNNMLNIILGYSQLALMKIEPTSPLNTDLQEIMNAARRSADLVRQLLAFARKQIIAPKVLDINDTVGSMLNMLRRLIGEDIDLLWSPAANIWPVKMDPTQVDQLLANLAVNARDSISGVGKITIETGEAEFDEAYCAKYTYSVPGQYVMLGVSDDGCGMDKETCEQIFDPFFTTKEFGKGTGMGLATVYGIVKQNNGFINVYSEPGTGTTFKIYLPRHGGEAEEVIDEPHEHAKPLTGTETVLLVEDNEVLLNMSKIMLEELGYTVLATSNPNEAIKLAEQYAGDIHLLLTDVVMPEMSGRDLQKRLSDLRPGIKCLFISGYTADVIAHRGILDEGVNFLQKPFLINDLAAKVWETVGK